MDEALRVWAEVGVFWPWVITAMVLSCTTVAAGHALLVKRDPGAAIAWVGVILLAPPLGALLYFVAGVNRIERQAAKRRMHKEVHISKIRAAQIPLQGEQHPHIQLDGHDGPTERENLNSLARLVDQVEPRRLLDGNLIEPLLCGDEAYPAMLEAIDHSEKSVALSSYIFDNDAAGLRFRKALASAVKRGVEVRVLIDSVGARYTIPPITWGLARDHINVARFGRTIVPWRFAYFNLRNHRKVLVVDGTLGFTGGMNIRAGHIIGENPAHPVKDLHFRVEGPVVRHLMEVFALDWSFTTGETLTGELWFPPLDPAGDVTARGINDGPDEEFERLQWTILGACSAARRSIQILTPYFIPEQALIAALSVAAMRGVKVDIILPGKNNLAIVDWASRASWQRILENGPRIYLSSGVFDHTKLMIVDGEWVLLGSANLDPRSLRLNFEFNVECYNRALGEQLQALFVETSANSTRVSLAALREQSFVIRLRNAVARLFSPYL